MHSKFQLSVVALLLIVFTAGISFAENFPAKPIRLIVPNQPGGGLGLIATLAADGLSKNLGHRVIVDYRPGASGSLALDLTKQAKADGYTMIIISSTQVINSILSKTNYDLFRDFEPVTQTTAAPYLMVVYPGLPVKNVRELIAYAKQHPGQLNYASAGSGSLQQLSMELFKEQVGIDAVHIPYKGSGPALPELISGQTQIMMSTIMALLPQVKEKSLRPLAVTSQTRSPILPEVPTMIEAGVPGFLITQWHGMLVPAGTPKAIVEFLHTEISKAMRSPEVSARLSADGTTLVESSPQKFGAHLKAEHERWAKVIKQAGIKR